MKESKKEVIVVTEYITDFGTKVSDKDHCEEVEDQEYMNVYNSLYRTASREQKLLLDAMMYELKERRDGNYCELGISNDALRHLIYNL